MPATTFRSGKRRVREQDQERADAAGPTRSASSAPTPTSEATLSQRPRTSRELRRSASSAGSSSSSTTWASSTSGRRARWRPGWRIAVAVEHEPDRPRRRARPPSSGRSLRRARGGRRAIGPIGRPSSISTSAQAVAAWTRREAEEGQRRADARRRAARALPPTRPSCRRRRARSPPRTSACSSEMTAPSGMKQQPDAEEQRRALRRTSAPAAARI